MPEFQLNADRYGKHSFYKLSDFAKGYVEAMFFTNGDIGNEENKNLLNDLGVEKLTQEAVRNIAACTDRFWSENGVDLYLAAAKDGYDESRAGHDFWFSRQGHGGGYSNRDLGDVGDVGDRLQKAAQEFGEAYPEVARGWIYHR